MDVFVLGVVRTPIGQMGGVLREWHPAALLSTVLDESLVRSGLDNAAIDSVIGVCSVAVGEQAMNVTRSAVLGAGWDETTRALTLEGGAAGIVDALALAAGRLALGARGPVMVAGVESASRVPAGSAIGSAVGKPFGPAVHARYAESGGLRAPAAVAEVLANRLGIDREVMDAWALESRSRHARRKPDHDSALMATDARWNRPGESPVLVDEPSPVTDVAACVPMFETTGSVTAGNLALPGDGAGVVLVATEQMCAAMGLAPVAQLRFVGSTGVSPVEGSSGAAIARYAASQAHLNPGLIEVLEDTAVTPLGLARELGRSLEAVNPHGGALATANAEAASAVSMIGSLVDHTKSDDSSAMGVIAGSGAQAGALIFTKAKLSTG